MLYTFLSKIKELLEVTDYAIKDGKNFRIGKCTAIAQQH
jgi:hypothetical protein